MLSLWLALFVSSPPSCLVQAEPHHWPVRVTASDAAEQPVTFEVVLQGATAEVTLTGPVAEAEPLHVVAPLDFRGAQAALPLALREGRAVGDVVQLTPEVRLAPLAIEGTNVRVRALLASDVQLEPMTVACDALGLGALPGDAIAHTPERAVVFPVAEPLSGANTLTLTPKRGRGQAVTVHWAASEDLPLRLRTKRRDLSEVEATFSNGASLRGWVPTDRIRSPGGFAGYARGQGGVCGTMGGRRPTLRAGAPVFAAAGATKPWAHASADVMVTVQRRETMPGWVQLRQVPGLREGTQCNFEHAWVKGSDLSP